MQQIGRVIRQARKARGFTQQRLAKQVGMSRSTISAIENGSFSEVGIRKVEALLNQLGYTLQAAPLHQRPSLTELKGINFHEG